MTPCGDVRAIIRFVEHGLWNGEREFGPATAMGWQDAQGIVAGVVFHEWAPHYGVIELSSYSARRDWLNKDRLREIFAYPFAQLGCRVAVARISEKNARVRRIWRALGASEVIIPDLRADGEGECVATLKRSDWLQSRFMRSGVSPNLAALDVGDGGLVDAILGGECDTQLSGCEAPADRSSIASGQPGVIAAAPICLRAERL